MAASTRSPARAARPSGPPLAAALAEIAGAQHVISEAEAQRRFLRDFSWYSPLLTSTLSSTLAGAPCEAVVCPHTPAELKAVVALAARTGTPLTVRGAGTGNYGQSLPLRGGILVDVRGLDRVLAVGPHRITVEPGTVLGDAEAAARVNGRELRVLPSTYRRATAAGYVAGGSGGIGSVTYGTLWDGNVLAADVLSAEDPPRTVELVGDELDVILHTYGTAGVISRLTFPLVPARTWAEGVATFRGFDGAAAFAWAVCEDAGVAKRLVSLQEAPIPTFFGSVGHLFGPGDSAVLLMVDAEHTGATERLVAAHGGRYRPWPEKPDITQYPFSHTILWAKHHDPTSTWLQLEFDAADFFRQLKAVTARWGGRFLHHVEFARTRSGALKPLGIPVLVDADPAAVDEMMRFLTAEGMRVLNPHTYVAEEGGMVADLDRVLAFKRRMDPQGLLNPGKIGARFYTAPR